MAKNILVTGCCGGMGAAICKRLSSEGFRVFGLDIRIPDTAGFDCFECDVTSEDSIKNVFEQISKKTDKLDAVIHTAGIYDLDSLVEIDEERFTRIFNINLFGIYRINRIFLPMLGKGSRIIITTSELAPLYPLPFTGLYAITKTALERYAFSLRTELRLLGIDVCVIRPGAVKTGLLNDSTTALDRFCESTELYNCNAARFRSIVNSVEARNITPDRIAAVAAKALKSRRPKRIYSINRNPLLLLLNILPPNLQSAIIAAILKK